MRNFGSYIPLTVSMQSCPSFPHGLFGVFISQGAVLGDNVTIFQQVTIGSNTLRGSRGAGVPVIGDNVYIGAGAKIIGAVTVGPNVRIGANAVVVKDVPANSTVVLTQPRVICTEEPPDNTFVPYSEELHSKV